MTTERDFTFTVDHPDSRDLDDAISISTSEDTWIVGVHIADVARRVSPRSAEDRNARERGLSEFLPSGEIPMLPDELVERCSLFPGERKAVISVFWEVNPKTLEMSRLDLVRGWIVSDRRFTYDEFQKIMSDPLSDDRGPEIAMICKLHRKIRKDRGTSWLDLGLSKQSKFDTANGRVVGVHSEKMTESMRVIETFMVEANAAAADFLNERLPSGKVVIRTQNGFVPETAERLERQMRGVGFVGFSLRDNASFTESIKHLHPHTKKRVELCVAPAVEVGENAILEEKIRDGEFCGHQSLGRSLYCHFTSPIRRFTDILVQRSIVNAINGTDIPICVDGLQETLNTQNIVARAKKNKEREAKSRAFASLVRNGLFNKPLSAFVSSIIPNFARGEVFVNIILDDHPDLPLSGMLFSLTGNAGEMESVLNGTFILPKSQSGLGVVRLLQTVSVRLTSERGKVFPSFSF